MPDEKSEEKVEKTPNLPIGYWLKRADAAITARIDEAQGANGLSRIEWQVLNVLHEVGTATPEQLADSLGVFADMGSLGDTARRLAGRGLIEEGFGASSYRLTGQGRQVHDAALRLQKQVRQQAVRGVSESDYATTLRVLQLLVENLTVGGR